MASHGGPGLAIHPDGAGGVSASSVVSNGQCWGPHISRPPPDTGWAGTSCSSVAPMASLLHANGLANEMGVEACVWLSGGGSESQAMLSHVPSAPVTGEVPQNGSPIWVPEQG